MRKKVSTYKSHILDSIAEQLVLVQPNLALHPKVQRSILRRINQGRGQGAGPIYMPWLTVRDKASRGYSTRIKGWKTNRVHHFFNRLERSYFATLEWAPRISDIREHYPLLPLELTMAIADMHGIKHPYDPRTLMPAVMTTDFLVTEWNGSAFVEKARTVTYANNLKNRRTLAEFEIERHYWGWRKTSWGIVTEESIPKTLSENVMFLHSYRALVDRPGLTPAMIELVADALEERLLVSNEPLRHLTAECDALFGLIPGSSLSVAYHMMAMQVWKFDENRVIEPGEKFVLLNAQELCMASKLQGGYERNIA